MIAVAQPYRPRPAGSVAPRWARERRTGAAANAFGVNTAAAAAAGRTPDGSGTVATIVRSGRPDALIPAIPLAAAKPAGMIARRSTAGSVDGRAASPRR